MKIIDFELKGNMVRFFLGNDTDEDYHGDDWNDVSYEDNAGTVYPDYVTGTVDLAFPFDALVLEPGSGYGDSGYCKDDMKAGVAPCVIVVPPELVKDSYHDDFKYWSNCKGILKFYFNDRMEPSAEPVLFAFDPKENRAKRQSYTSYMIEQQKNKGENQNG